MSAEFRTADAEVNGTRLHYVIGGSGEPLVLLHGWPRTHHQFHKVLPALAERFTVIAPDLRGAGASAKPDGGYDKKTMALDVYALVRQLGYEQVNVAGEDIGSMVAFAFAANHPEATRRVALWEPGHPDESFRSFPLLPSPGAPHLWWFAFNQVEGLPEQLLAGRGRLLIDAMIDVQAMDPTAFDETTRELYAEAYGTPDAIRATNGWYRAFWQDIDDATAYPELTMPVLVLGGLLFEPAKALIAGRAKDVRLVEFPGAGHYLAEERPGELTEELIAFFDAG
jgi:pimeloyl-ACP methyl ester carboxylesterase